MRAWIPRRSVDPAAAELGGQLDDIRQAIREIQEAGQAEFRSIDDGSLDIYDDDDNLRARLGRQPDGSFTVKAFGKKPETPTEPDVIPVAGGCVVEWDGSYEDGQAEDIHRIAVHLGTTPNFAIVTDDDEDDSDEESTERAAIMSPRGGSAFLALDPDETYYIRLTAVAEGGAESDPTDAVEVYVSAPEAKFWQDHFNLAAPGPQTLTLTRSPLPNSEHLYWNGLYQREDTSWTGIGRKVSLLDTGTPPAAGDIVVVEYAYLDEDEGEIPLPYKSEGWSYLLGGAGSARDAQGPDSIAPAAPNYDDSAWAVGSMPFGSTEPNTGNPQPYADWTFWPTQTSIWVRRDIVVDPGVRALKVSTFMDNYARYYWNGVEVANLHISFSATAWFTIPAELVETGINRLAIWVSDETTQKSQDGCVIDVKIEYLDEATDPGAAPWSL